MPNTIIKATEMPTSQKRTKKSSSHKFESNSLTYLFIAQEKDEKKGGQKKALFLARGSKVWKQPVRIAGLKEVSITHQTDFYSRKNIWRKH